MRLHVEAQLAAGAPIDHDPEPLPQGGFIRVTLHTNLGSIRILLGKILLDTLQRGVQWMGGAVDWGSIM